MREKSRKVELKMSETDRHFGSKLLCFKSFMPKNLSKNTRCAHMHAKMGNLQEYLCIDKSAVKFSTILHREDAGREKPLRENCSWYPQIMTFIACEKCWAASVRQYNVSSRQDQGTRLKKKMQYLPKWTMQIVLC